MHTTVICYIVTVIHITEGYVFTHYVYVAKVMGDYLTYLCVYVDRKTIAK